VNHSRLYSGFNEYKRGDNMENFIRNLIKEKTLINKVFLALLCSQLAIILASFFKIAVLPSFGKLNLYAMASMATLFLISSVIEIVFTLKKNEKVFITLRVVNLLWLFSLIGHIVKQIEDLQKTESLLDFGAGVVENLYSWLSFGIVNFSIPRSGYSYLLGTVNIIRILADISLVILLIYVYLRFFKKDEFDTTPCIEGSLIAKLQTAYKLDKVVTGASVALILSLFLRFWSNGRIAVPAFGTRPFIASATIALSVFMIQGVLVKDAQKLERSILIVLITFILWNPISAFRQGVGVGYLLYLVAIITLGVVYIKRHEVKKVAEPQPVQQKETTKPEESIKEETVIVEEQSVKDEQPVDKEESKPEEIIKEEKAVVAEEPVKGDEAVNDEDSKSEEEDSDKK
jgi:membrane protein